MGEDTTEWILSTLNADEQRKEIFAPLLTDGQQGEHLAPLFASSSDTLRYKPGVKYTAVV
jgi:hypothetical protein